MTGDKRDHGANQELPDDIITFWRTAEDRLPKLVALAKAYVTLPVALCGCWALLFKVWVGAVNWQLDSVLFCLLWSGSLSGFKWLN